jgi:hypothetical protein
MPRKSAHVTILSMSRDATDIPVTCSKFDKAAPEDIRTAPMTTTTFTIPHKEHIRRFRAPHAAIIGAMYPSSGINNIPAGIYARMCVATTSIRTQFVGTGSRCRLGLLLLLLFHRSRGYVLNCGF